jgi:poly(rC)-binding protein 2/3/4
LAGSTKLAKTTTNPKESQQTKSTQTKREARLKQLRCADFLGAMLKRKNEEDNNDKAKRVALDAELVVEDPKEGTQDGGKDENEDHPMADASNHEGNEPKSVKIDSDPTYVCFRMLCLAKEAGLVVGKGGEKINHIKEVSQARINVSENIKDVVERVIFVRGPSENVARAFGLIVRAILGEEEGKPSDTTSHQYDLRLLISNHTIGYIIGKQGSKFREIEDKSAASLSADSQMLPLSTDRCLTIRGVADAIHIATYYVAQTILEYKSFARGETIFYDPVKGYRNNKNPLRLSNNGMVMNYGAMPPVGGLMGQPHFAHFGSLSPRPAQSDSGSFINPMGMGALSLPLAEHAQVAHDLYIPNDYVGNVIGKMGKNIKHIKERTGSNVIIGEPEEGSSQRRITIVGNAFGNQTAMFLINDRINMDKKANEAKALLKKQQQKREQQQQFQQENEEPVHIDDDDDDATNGAMALE